KGVLARGDRMVYVLFEQRRDVRRLSQTAVLCSRRFLCSDPIGSRLEPCPTGNVGLGIELTPFRVPGRTLELVDLTEEIAHEFGNPVVTRRVFGPSVGDEQRAVPDRVYGGSIGD